MLHMQLLNHCPRWRAKALPNMKCMPTAPCIMLHVKYPLQHPTLIARLLRTRLHPLALTENVTQKLLGVGIVSLAANLELPWLLSHE